MKDIRIFVASSKELIAERNALSYFVILHEEEFEKRGLKVRLSKWEYVDPNMTGVRTEDRYLDEMLNSDAALILFRNVMGMYTEEEMTKAIAAEEGHYSRLKAHRILFSEGVGVNPVPALAAYRARLSPDSYGTFTNQNELECEFLALVDRLAGMENLQSVPLCNIREITAFLAADDELSAERNAFADMVLGLNDLLLHRNLRVRLRFFCPKDTENLVGNCEMGLVLYQSTFKVFGREEMRDAYERTKRGENPKRLYVYFRDEEGEELSEEFKTFRNEFVEKLGHFFCQVGGEDSLRLSFLIALERYAGETIEIYSTVDTASSVFVGRDDELKRLHELFAEVPGCFPHGRIPVITGAGGTGKSELIRQYVSQLRVEYPGGVFQVDMEHVKDWDEAFLRLLDRPSNNGISVEECLGFKKKDEGETGAGTESASSRHTGEEVRDALLRRARSAGPILLVLDNIEECGELFDGGGISKMFPVGFSERITVNAVATARVFDTDASEGDVLEFPLGDLSPETSLELLLSQYPAETDEERTAAADVARLLGYRAIFLRRVPAIIGTKNFKKAKMVCRSYASLAKALEKDSLAAISRTEKVDEQHLPTRLWELTRDAVSELYMGDAAVQLIRLAAHFSPDGFPKNILRHLWDKEVFPLLEDEDMECSEAFDFVFDICRTYNIMQGDGQVRIHRLDREAILKDSAEEEAALSEAIGKVLAAITDASQYLWLSLSEFPRVFEYLPEKLASGGFYAELLALNPKCEYLCKFEKLQGRDWRWLLVMQPQFADKCPWERLEGNDWGMLLVSQPQFADKCPWEKLEGIDWAILLRHCPEFADMCVWSKLSGRQLIILLRSQPQFADKCPWEKLDGWRWASLLRSQPQFADKCPWEKLEGNDWGRLLVRQPQFADKCPWEKLEGNDWGRLLVRQPQFADKCPWEKLEGDDWGDLLSSQPQFADRCPWEKLDGNDWGDLLSSQPQFADKCPWEKLDGNDWGNLLSNLPQFADKCPWEKLDGGNWCGLLSSQPQFADKCPWEKLDRAAWCVLLSSQPQFSDKCPWGGLDGMDLISLLVDDCQIVDRSRFEAIRDFALDMLTKE